MIHVVSENIKQKRNKMNFNKTLYNICFVLIFDLFENFTVLRCFPKVEAVDLLISNICII